MYCSRLCSRTGQCLIISNFNSAVSFSNPHFLIYHLIPMLCKSSRRDDSNEWSQHRNQLRLKEILQKMYTVCIVICIVRFMS